MPEVVTTSDVLMYLQITVTVLAILVLYHALFVVVDLRKMIRRIKEVSNEVENIIMKPIHAADYVLDGIVQYIESQNASAAKKTSTKKKK